MHVALTWLVVVICWMLSAAIAAAGVYLFRRMQPRGPDVRRGVAPHESSSDVTNHWLEDLFSATPDPDLMQRSTPSTPSAPLFRSRMAKGSTPPYGQAQTHAASLPPLRPQTEPVGDETTATDTIIVDPSVFEDSSTPD